MTTIDPNSIFAKLAEKIDKDVTADAEKECKLFKQQIYNNLNAICPNPHGYNYKFDINGNSVPLYDIIEAFGCKYIDMYKRIRTELIAQKMLEYDKENPTSKPL